MLPAVSERRNQTTTVNGAVPHLYQGKGDMMTEHKLDLDSLDALEAAEAMNPQTAKLLIGALREARQAVRDYSRTMAQDCDCCRLLEHEDCPCNAGEHENYPPEQTCVAVAPPGCVVVREEDLRALIVGVMNSDGSCCTCFPHDGECQPQHASCGESLLAHFGLEVTDGEAE